MNWKKYERKKEQYCVELNTSHTHTHTYAQYFSPLNTVGIGLSIILALKYTEWNYLVSQIRFDVLAAYVFFSCCCFALILDCCSFLAHMH